MLPPRQLVAVAVSETTAVAVLVVQQGAGLVSQTGWRGALQTGRQDNAETQRRHSLSGAIHVTLHAPSLITRLPSAMSRCMMPLPLTLLAPLAHTVLFPGPARIKLPLL